MNFDQLNTDPFDNGVQCTTRSATDSFAILLYRSTYTNVCLLRTVEYSGVQYSKKLSEIFFALGVSVLDLYQHKCLKPHDPVLLTLVILTKTTVI